MSKEAERRLEVAFAAGNASPTCCDQCNRSYEDIGTPTVELYIPKWIRDTDEKVARYCERCADELGAGECLIVESDSEEWHLQNGEILQRDEINSHRNP